MVLTLETKARDARGKAAAKLAKDDLMPAVCYGPKKEAMPVSVPLAAFKKVWKEAGESTIVKLEGALQGEEALIQDVDVNPLTGEPRHADFYMLEKGKKVEVAVPIEFVGEAPAVKAGGNLIKVLYEMEVEALPANLPHEIVVDVSVLTEMDQKLHVKDIVMPAGVEAKTDGEEVVALIAAAVEEKEEAPAADIGAIEISEDRGKKEAAEGEGEAKA
jgi:large subunit ribosomal protein L25